MAMTASSDYWSGLRESLTQIGLDTLRARLIDVERRSDDQNVPDNADLRYGYGAGPVYQTAPAGVPLPGWILLGLAVAAGAIFFAER